MRAPAACKRTRETDRLGRRRLAEGRPDRPQPETAHLPGDTERGDHRKVRSLQKLMLRSYSNILMSVRRVTQVNAGKNTPGVDKLVVKTPAARGELVDQLATFQPWRAKPVAAGVHPEEPTASTGPSGIPTVDRPLPSGNGQERAGARLGSQVRGLQLRIPAGARLPRCHRKRSTVSPALTGGRNGSWTRTSRGLSTTSTRTTCLKPSVLFPARELIRQWLKAGYWKMASSTTPKPGTPQGGVISPLLLNIALARHGSLPWASIQQQRARS